MRKVDWKFWGVMLLVVTLFACLPWEQVFGQSGGWLGSDDGYGEYPALEKSYQYLRNKYGKEGAQQWLEQTARGEHPTVQPLPVPKVEWPMDGHPPGYTYPDDEVGKRADRLEVIPTPKPSREKWQDEVSDELLDIVADDKLTQLERKLEVLEKHFGVCTEPDPDDSRLDRIQKRLETVEAAAEVLKTVPKGSKIIDIYQYRNGKWLKLPTLDTDPVNLYELPGHGRVPAPNSRIYASLPPQGSSRLIIPKPLDWMKPGPITLR